MGWSWRLVSCPLAVALQMASSAVLVSNGRNRVPFSNEIPSSSGSVWWWRWSLPYHPCERDVFQAGSLSTGAPATGHMVQLSLPHPLSESWGSHKLCHCSACKVPPKQQNPTLYLYACLYMTWGQGILCPRKSVGYCHGKCYRRKADSEPGAKALSRFKGIIHYRTCSEGEGCLPKPCITQCTDYLVLCNRSHENSGLKQ